MKKTFLALLLFALSSSFSALSACSCAFVIDYFCEGLTEQEYVFLGVITESLSSHGMEVEVIENIFKEIPESSIDILGQDGINCAQSLDNFSVGDTLLLAVNETYATTDFLPHLSQDFFWELGGCSLRYLSYDSGVLSGMISPDVTSMSLEDFREGLIPCIEESYTEVAPDFPEVGAVWKLRGLDNNMTGTTNSPTCEYSQCGGSYWQYEVDRKEIVADKVCSILQVYHGDMIDNLSLIREFAILDQAGKIYYYEDSDEEFKLMLDFTLEVGDTLVSYAPLESEAYTIKEVPFRADGKHISVVEEVDFIEINGQMLKRQTFAHASDEFPTINSIVIEGIGNIGPFFGEGQVYAGAYACAGQFLCYEQGDFTYSVFGDDCPCQLQDQISNVLEVDEFSDISVYPNPASDRFTISTNDQAINRLELVDMSGKTRITKENINQSHTIIDAESLESGIYILLMESTNGEMYYDKIVVD